MTRLTVLQPEPPSEEEPPPLPDLQDAVLAEAEVDALFADLATHATVGEIVWKGGATDRAQGAAPSLQDAREALRSGAVRGVQIRYLHEGRRWWDTLMRVPGGVRLVRIER